VLRDAAEGEAFRLAVVGRPDFSRFGGIRIVNPPIGG
jgi:hypothetical protein